MYSLPILFYFFICSVLSLIQLGKKKNDKPIRKFSVENILLLSFKNNYTELNPLHPLLIGVPRNEYSIFFPRMLSLNIIEIFT